MVLAMLLGALRPASDDPGVRAALAEALHAQLLDRDAYLKLAEDLEGFHWSTSAPRPPSDDQRAQVLEAAYAAHPERFVNKAPVRPSSPGQPGSTNHKSRRMYRRNLEDLSQRA